MYFSRRWNSAGLLQLLIWVILLIVVKVLISLLFPGQKIIITMSVEEILEDIDNAGHNAFVEEDFDKNVIARKAMTERIRFYQKLINEKKLKVKK